MVETWDTLGMRGTASHDVVFHGVRVPASAVGVRLPAEAPAWDPRFANVVKWFLSLMSGVYVGIADRAREEAIAAVGAGRNSAFRDAALTEMLVGRLEAAHFRADAAHETGLGRVAAASDPVQAMVAAITMKDSAIEASVEVVDMATQIAGGRSYFKKSVLERLTRDVRAAAHHPPSTPVSSQMVGRNLLQQVATTSAEAATQPVAAS